MQVEIWNCTRETELLIQELHDQLKSVTDRYSELIGKSESASCIIDVDISVSVDKEKGERNTP